MRLTGEQTDAIEAFGAGGDVRLMAYAGTGKTSTLVAMARMRGGMRRGLYVAFNKAIAADAGRKFDLSGAQCRTAHSLAFRAIAGQGYGPAKLTAPLSARTARPLIADSDLREALGGGIAPVLTFGAVRRFCQSAAARPGPEHVPRPVVIPDNWEQVRERTAEMAGRIWAMATDPCSAVPLGHDGYLKLWALQEPRLDALFDYLMVDEAQDLNPVLVEVVRSQSCQRVVVGDGHQSIYQWRGAVNAMETLPGEVRRLTMSFRFGSEIAASAWRVLQTLGETAPLEGNPAVEDLVTGDAGEDMPDAVVCRTNSGVFTVASKLMRDNWPIHVPGGVAELRAMAADAEMLMRSRPATSADLLGFEDWAQVCEHADTEEGAGLKVFVRLVEEYGPRGLMEMLSKIAVQPSRDTVTVTTAHKSKGLEWPAVEVHDDFGRAGKRACDAERRLFYVSMTRAGRILMVRPGVLSSYVS